MDSRLKVLLVEDEPVSAADVSRKLLRLGYNVQAIASHADEAFLAAATARPDVVLMDINLAGDDDGIEAATRIYSRLDIPVVFLTGHDDIETLQRAQKADPFGYLTKPATPAGLANSIQIALTRYRKQSAQHLREIWLEAQLESAGEGLIAASREGAIRLINAEGERLLGISSRDIRGKLFAAVVPLRHRITGEPIQDIVRLALLHGTTINIGEDYVVEGLAERTISGEVAISRLAGEPIGVVFTFRDSTVQRYAGNQICNQLVKPDSSDCTRSAIYLNQTVSEVQPALVTQLSPGSQLKLCLSESVRPVMGNRRIIETLLLGLVQRAQVNVGNNAKICISVVDLDFERKDADGNTARYVRLQVAYQGSGERESYPPAPSLADAQSLSIDLTMATVQSALQSLRATAQAGSSDGWSYWDINIPASVGDLTATNSHSDSAIVVLIEPDDIVREVLCRSLTGDVYECLGARNPQEGLDWARSFPGQVDIVILPEDMSSLEMQALMDESPAASLLLVRNQKSPKAKLLGGCSSLCETIDSLFSQAGLREALDRLLLARASSRNACTSADLAGLPAKTDESGAPACNLVRFV